MYEADAHFDFETYSACDLRTQGLYRYAEDRTTGTFGFAWSLSTARDLIYTWRPGMDAPVHFLNCIEQGGVIGCHNAAFERTIWKMLRERYPQCASWPSLPIKQQNCTQARAAAHGLPQSLDMLSTVLKFKQRKDEYGYNLMLKASSPRKRNADGTFVWLHDTAPDTIDYLMMNYCPQDVRAESEADEKLPQLSAHERKVWELDQEINDRGVYVDEAAITNAIDVVLLAKKAADRKMAELTDGAVKKCSQVIDIVKWLNAQGIVIDSAKKGNHDEIMALADLTNNTNARKVIELRKEASKTSTAKYAKMLHCVCADGRIRGLLNYHGAGTGRWAGRLVQPQNFPRVDPDTDGPMVEYTVWCLAQQWPLVDIYDMIELGGFEVLPALSKSLRGMICAA